MEVTARNLATGESISAVGAFEFLSRILSGPTVNATAHPLVFLLSTPACAEGAVMSVEFRTGTEPTVVLFYLRLNLRHNRWVLVRDVVGFAGVLVQVVEL